MKAKTPSRLRPSEAPITANPELSLINESQAAVLLGMSLASLRSRRASHTAPAFYRIGGKIRYAKSDLADFVAACRQPVDVG
jgi:hypothetical protein